MGETEAGKTVAQSISEQHHQFVKENGTIVLSALVARAAGTVAKGESVSKNAQEFGKSAFMHIGSNALGEYVINPGIDKLMGSEDTNSKKCVKFVANAAVMLGLHVGLNAGLKMLNTSDGSGQRSISEDYMTILNEQHNAFAAYFPPKR